MVANKIIGHAKVRYDVFLDADDLDPNGESYVGKIREVGTKTFLGLGYGDNPTFATKRDATSVLNQLASVYFTKTGIGEQRSFTVTLPGLDANGEHVKIQDTCGGASVLENMKNVALTTDLKHIGESVIIYETRCKKSLEFDDEITQNGLQARLNFQLTCKNFGKVDGDVHLSSGCAGNHTYRCQIKGPFSPFQAFTVFMAVLHS